MLCQMSSTEFQNKIINFKYNFLNNEDLWIYKLNNFDNYSFCFNKNLSFEYLTLITQKKHLKIKKSILKLKKKVFG